MERLHYLETGSTDPAYNLAFEEYVLTHRMDGDYLILWQNDNTVVVGQNQNTAAEINRAFVEAHGVHVVRRTTGGGAVYHDLGNLNYSFITDEEAGSLRLERFTAPVVDALASLGLQAEASGRNDILVEGRKVSGTAQRVYKTRILHHGTLLFDSDPDMVAGALNVVKTFENGISGRSHVTFGTVFTNSRISGYSKPVSTNTAGTSGSARRTKSNSTVESFPPEKETATLPP